MKLAVIWPDVTATPKSYVTLEKDELLVSKTFFTIQGEGPYSGRPALFIRLAGCNFGGKGKFSPGCSFCDADFRLNQGVPESFDSLYQKIAEAFSTRGRSRKSPSPFCVITGGEPLLQDNLRGFMRNSPKDYVFQIESNGTRIPPSFPKYPYLVVSPKIPTLHGQYKTGYPKLPKRVFERADCLKFLISADPSSPYYTLPDYATEYPGPVYLSPIAEYQIEPFDSPSILDVDKGHIWKRRPTLENHKRAAQLSMKYGFILSIQQQIYLGLE